MTTAAQPATAKAAMVKMPPAMVPVAWGSARISAQTCLNCSPRDSGSTRLLVAAKNPPWGAGGGETGFSRETGCAAVPSSGKMNITTLQITMGVSSAEVDEEAWSPAAIPNATKGSMNSHASAYRPTIRTLSPLARTWPVTTLIHPMLSRAERASNSSTNRANPASFDPR